MEIITSKENSIFRDLVRLSQKKYRDREGRFVAEGPNAVSEALSNDAVKVVTVIAREGSAYEEFSEDTKVLSGDLFDRVSDTVTSQGILAVLEKPDRGTPSEILEGALSAGNILVLDRLQDPGNIGTILRTADAAGFDMACFIKGTGDPYSPKIVRAAAGSLFRLPIIFVNDNDELEDLMRQYGKRIIATAMEGDKAYYETDLSENCAIVIGNEGNGVSSDLLRRADEIIRIPMAGNTESLNASVAAGILMYERIRRQNERSITANPR